MMDRRPQWELNRSISQTDHHALLYRDEALGVQKEVHTPVQNFPLGKFGKGKRYFYIDGDEREFTSEAELMDALRHAQGRADVGADDAQE